MAGDEIGVEVGEEDVADLEAEFFGVGQILLDVALRVDDDGSRTGLVSEQIGGVGEAAEVILFQDHRSSRSLPRQSAGGWPGTLMRNMPLAHGDKLGPYQILSPVGKGGMGEVFKARDTRLGRTVAIKVLLQRDAAARARFQQEARVICSLN